MSSQPGPAKDDRAHLVGVEYANGWALAKNRGDPSVELLIHPLLASMVSALVHEGKHRLLDAGCGDGARSQFLKANFPTLEVVAGDYNAALVEAASANLPGASVLQLDIGQAFPFGDGSFDDRDVWVCKRCHSLVMMTTKLGARFSNRPAALRVLPPEPIMGGLRAFRARRDASRPLISV